MPDRRKEASSGPAAEGAELVQKAPLRDGLAERAFHAWADSVPHLLWTADGKGRLELANRRVREYFGEETDLRGTSWLARAHPQDLAAAKAAWDEAVGNGTALQSLLRLRCHGRGAWRWHEVRALPDTTAPTQRWLVTATDVDRRCRAEEARRRLAAEIARARDRERRRLTEILHDELQQHLVALRVAMGRLARWKDAPPRYEGLLRKSDDLLARCLQKTRELAQDPCPPALDEEGLGPALRLLAAEFKSDYELKVELDLGEEVEPLPPGMRRLLFKGARELLFNVVKHSGADEASLRTRRRAGHLELTVADEGSGFDVLRVEEAGAPADGLGLAMLRQQIASLGGDLRVASASGAGSRFVIEVPEHDDGLPADGQDDQSARER